MRISLAIGIFNALMIYLPFTSNKFGEFYGLGNLDTIFYFFTPYFILRRLHAMNIKKRLLLSTISIGGFYSLKLLKKKLIKL